MSQIRNRVFTERGSSRASAPFGCKPAPHAPDRAADQPTLQLTDRKPAGERDEVASSVVLGYN